MTKYQIGPETFITLSYGVKDEEGEVVSEPEVLGTVFGMGFLFPKVEQALEGRVEGERLVVRLPADEAYGKRRADAILHVDRSEFPPEVSHGDCFELENADGGILVVHVLEVTDEEVVIDTNHPLAEQEMEVELEILEVRPASSEEMQAAEAALEEDHAYFEAASEKSEKSGVDVALNRLIRGKSQG